MTRLAMWIAVVIALLPRPAVAQQGLFVEGLAELARTMLTSSGDAGRAVLFDFENDRGESPNLDIRDSRPRPCRSRPIRSMTPA